MSTHQKAFGAELTRLMDERNQGPSDLVAFFGCHRITVWLWQTGRTVPSGRYRRKLLEAYPSLAGLLRLAERG